MLVETRTAHNRPTVTTIHEPELRCSILTAADSRSRRPDASPYANVPGSGPNPIPIRTPSSGEAGRSGLWPDYLEALELLNGAAQAMSAMEDHSERIQAKAFELTGKAKADRLAASQQIASLEQQLAASETRAAELNRLLAEAELRAQTAQEWLQRFLETINGTFSALRNAQHRREGIRNPAA
jgi:hypothetical protein